MKGTDFVSKSVFDETLIMEQISQSPHPNIIKYHGCRVRRGRITAIVLERLDCTLTQYISTPAFQGLDKARFIEALESAVDYLHSLGLAHNDINPYNIMVRDGMPVLIDFGSCQPFGMRLQSLGSPGWCEETFFTSEKKHDVFSMGKLRQWIQDPK
jgi:serine/threonine protein kinase